MAHRLFGLGEIDLRARLHAERVGVPDTENLDAVGAPPQRLLRPVRPQPRDQADDLAGAHIERGDQRGALGRYRLHLRGKAVAERAHASPPLPLALSFRSLSFSASLRACAAASLRRTVTRSGSRRSIDVISR